MTSVWGAIFPNTIPRDGICWYSLGSVLTNTIPMDSNPTTRIPNSCSCTCTSSSQKASHPNISETESGIIGGVKTTGNIKKNDNNKNKLHKEALSNHFANAWVTRPERPKGVKDAVKQARRAPTGDVPEISPEWRCHIDIIPPCRGEPSGLKVAKVNVKEFCFTLAYLFLDSRFYFWHLNPNNFRNNLTLKHKYKRSVALWVKQESSNYVNVSSWIVEAEMRQVSLTEQRCQGRF